jgi:hypothetical protein
VHEILLLLRIVIEILRISKYPLIVLWTLTIVVTPLSPSPSHTHALHFGYCSFSNCVFYNSYFIIYLLFQFSLHFFTSISFSLVWLVSLFICSLILVMSFVMLQAEFPIKQVLGNQENKPLGYTTFHLLTPDPTRFRLFVHHQASIVRKWNVVYPVAVFSWYTEVTR